jgi:hypothetical protein
MSKTHEASELKLRQKQRKKAQHTLNRRKNQEFAILKAKHEVKGRVHGI